MGKTVPISLPNGRNWPRKGDAVDHFKAMLARYSDGARVVDSTDHSDLASLLQVYDSVLDAGNPTKAGDGISHFERRKDRHPPGHTPSSFVVPTDGSTIAFSTRRALDVAGARVD